MPKLIGWKWVDNAVAINIALSAFSTIVRLAWDLIQRCGLLLEPRESLEAEILFLRRQLAMYRERGVNPKRIDAATRVVLTMLSRWFDWRSALVVVVQLKRWFAGIEPVSDCGGDGSVGQDEHRFRYSSVK